jgi:hypothetical protein
MHVDIACFVENCCAIPKTNRALEEVGYIFLVFRHGGRGKGIGLLLSQVCESTHSPKFSCLILVCIFLIIRFLSAPCLPNSGDSNRSRAAQAVSPQHVLRFVAINSATKLMSNKIQFGLKLGAMRGSLTKPWSRIFFAATYEVLNEKSCCVLVLERVCRG